VWRRELLVSDSAKRAGENAISSRPTVTLIDRSDYLPALLVRVSAAEDIAHIRALPHTDYVEPNFPVNQAEAGTEGSLGPPSDPEATPALAPIPLYDCALNRGYQIPPSVSFPWFGDFIPTVFRENRLA
jgi:hypothetical protein